MTHIPGYAPTQSPPPQSPARTALTALRGEVGKAVVGQDAAVTSLVIALICRGHVLLEGVPGTAKTLLVRSFAKALQIDTKRVQFTPDLMPGDITGSLIYDSRTAQFTFREGPVFTNLMLADEINRTPPKTQAALLEAMEERQVTVDGMPRPLPEPFIVAATQNPVEYEGTYPLPEAQLDRFLMKIRIDLPERDAEIEVLHRHAHGFDPHDLDGAGLMAVAGAADLEQARREVSSVIIHPQLLGVHRRRGAGDPVLAFAPARRLASWRDRHHADGPGLGVAVGPRLRLPRRREGAGLPDAAPPGGAPPRGRARRGDHRLGDRIDPGHGPGAPLTSSR